MSKHKDTSGLMHDQIWKAIDRLAQSFGYSPSGLAKQAGLDPTSFNKSKRVSADGKPRWPSTESISRILAATGASMSDFLSLLDEEAPSSTIPRYIPVIGFAQAGENGFFDEDGYPKGDSWDDLSFPDSKQHESIYALKVSGNSMEPLYREGEVLIVSPTATVRKGDRVIVKTNKGEVLAKELQKRSSSKVDLKSMNDQYETRSIPVNDISWMARIVWVSQ